VWDTPAFRRTNTIISWVWVAAFAVMTVSSVLTTEYPERERFFSWLIPVGAFILAVAFTREYSAAVQRRMHAEQAERRSS
jgi:tryptophan-rich sensory protein